MQDAGGKEGKKTNCSGLNTGMGNRVQVTHRQGRVIGTEDYGEYVEGQGSVTMQLHTQDVRKACTL